MSSTIRSRHGGRGCYNAWSGFDGIVRIEFLCFDFTVKSPVPTRKCSRDAERKIEDGLDSIGRREGRRPSDGLRGGRTIKLGQDLDERRHV